MSDGEWIILGVLGPFDVVLFILLWRYRKAVETMISTGINRWLIARHKPEDIGTLEPWCLACREAWPCAEWEKLHAEWDGIQQAKQEAER